MIDQATTLEEAKGANKILNVIGDLLSNSNIARGLESARPGNINTMGKETKGHLPRRQRPTAPFKDTQANAVDSGTNKLKDGGQRGEKMPSLQRSGLEKEGTNFT